MKEAKKIQSIIIQALENEGYFIPFAKYSDNGYVGFNVYSKENKLKNEIKNCYFIQIHD